MRFEGNDEFFDERQRLSQLLSSRSEQRFKIGLILLLLVYSFPWGSFSSMCLTLALLVRGEQSD